MRFFALSAAALSLASSALAESSWSTATSTRTVYMVTTETRIGTAPAETHNSTSTSVTTYASHSVAIPTPATNGTISGGVPTKTGPQPSFTGAAGKTTVGSIAVLIGGAVVALAL